MKHKCPICGKAVHDLALKRSSKHSFLPFCSERCKLIDLGAWLGEKYVIPAPDNPQPDQPEDEEIKSSK